MTSATQASISIREQARVLVSLLVASLIFSTLAPMAHADALAKPTHVVARELEAAIDDGSTGPRRLSTSGSSSEAAPAWAPRR